MLGGCIDVFPELLGTSLWPSLDERKDNILLLETSEVNMHEVMLSWFLRNLHAQGILHVIKGIVVGKPAFKDKLEKYKEVYKQIIGKEAKREDLPILYNVNFGHTDPMCILPIGQKVKVDLSTKEIIFTEKPMND